LSCSWNCKKYSVLIHTHGERPGSSVSSWLPDHHAAKRTQFGILQNLPCNMSTPTVGLTKPPIQLV
jgi:hypothetical protein